VIEERKRQRLAVVEAHAKHYIVEPKAGKVGTAGNVRCVFENQGKRGVGHLRR
jgi:hypothetical protein